MTQNRGRRDLGMHVTTVIAGVVKACAARAGMGANLMRRRASVCWLGCAGVIVLGGVTQANSINLTVHAAVADDGSAAIVAADVAPDHASVAPALHITAPLGRLAGHRRHDDPAWRFLWMLMDAGESVAAAPASDTLDVRQANGCFGGEIPGLDVLDFVNKPAYGGDMEAGLAQVFSPRLTPVVFALSSDTAISAARPAVWNFNLVGVRR